MCMMAVSTQVVQEKPLIGSLFQDADFNPEVVGRLSAKLGPEFGILSRLLLLVTLWVAHGRVRRRTALPLKYREETEENIY